MQLPNPPSAEELQSLPAKAPRRDQNAHNCSSPVIATEARGAASATEKRSFPRRKRLEPAFAAEKARPGNHSGAEGAAFPKALPTLCPSYLASSSSVKRRTGLCEGGGLKRSSCSHRASREPARVNASRASARRRPRAMALRRRTASKSSRERRLARETPSRASLSIHPLRLYVASARRLQKVLPAPSFCLVRTSYGCLSDASVIQLLKTKQKSSLAGRKKKSLLSDSLTD